MLVVVLSASPELSAQTSRGCGLLSATKGLTHAGTACPLSQPHRLEGFKGWLCCAGSGKTAGTGLLPLPGAG